MPTPHGLVPLSDKTTVEVFRRKDMSNRDFSVDSSVVSYTGDKKVWERIYGVDYLKKM